MELLAEISVFVHDIEITFAVFTKDKAIINRFLQIPSNRNKLISFLGAPILFSPLHLACELGDLSIVKTFIKAKVDVNLQRSSGETPIYLASQHGHHQLVEFLIEAQADVNLQEQVQGSSPIFIASQNGHDMVVKLLIEAQADVNLAIDTGESPLYIACQNGHLKVVNELIRAGADVDQSLETGESPLYIASQDGHHAVVDALIKAQADVNLREKINGESPLFIASQEGHHKVVDALIKAQATVNVQRTFGESPLYAAARNGHLPVVDRLIRAQADVNLRRRTGESPLSVASKNGHKQVVNLLIKHQAEATASLVGHASVENCTGSSANPSAASSQLSSETNTWATPGDSELSLQLHSALNSSGFVESRAALQAAVADVLQDILKRMSNYNEYFVMGSFSEGWGNNLNALDGKTDVDSDIDVMTLTPGKLCHLTDLCQCDVENGRKSEMSNGYLQYSGSATRPAHSSHGFPVRPAADLVPAICLCCYPPIEPLEPHRVACSNIGTAVLNALQQDVVSKLSPCHAVHAAAPDREGFELRVSTNFLEKRMLRSLSTLQGQLFVMLKYLIKKVICGKDNQQGLKTYHVKTITFRMVEETPVEQWQPENLVHLTRRSLAMLLDCLESSRTPENTQGRIMEHFFLKDAALYLKGAGQEGKSVDEILSSIICTLKAVIDQLPQTLQQFMNSLKPVSENGRFYFHPFAVLPDLDLKPLPTSGSPDYHEIYHLVKQCLVRLSDEDSSKESQVSLENLIATLPDCARTARQTLRALFCMKFGCEDLAKSIASLHGTTSVSRGIEWSGPKAEATPGFVWQHFISQDSAWKFCFDFERRPEFKFLNGTLAEKILPRTLSTKCFYVNFDAVMSVLQIDLGGDGVRELDATDWEEADVEELKYAFSTIFM